MTYQSIAIHFCDRPRCGARFTKTMPARRYCSENCRKRHPEEIAAQAKREAGEMIPHATRESIIEQIHAWVRTYGEIPGAADWNPALARQMGHWWRSDRFYADGCWPYTGTVQRLFGSWNAGIAAAGFEPRAVGHYDHYHQPPTPDICAVAT